MSFDKNRKYNVEANVVQMLGNPTRLKIIAGLCSRECNVKHIEEFVGLPQPVVSQHLALLRNKGIVKGTREGRGVRYKVVSDIAIKIVGLL